MNENTHGSVGENDDLLIVTNEQKNDYRGQEGPAIVDQAATNKPQP
jgi:hypothetical protein